MTEPEPYTSPRSTQLLDQLLNQQLERTRQTEAQQSEKAWEAIVDEMVEEDFTRGILPARQEIWEAASMSLENHPYLAADWQLFGDVNCGASWVSIKDVEGSAIEVTTQLQVFGWRETPKIIDTLQLFGYQGHTSHHLWGENFVKRRLGALPPTVLGVEPISSSRKLEYPQDQIARAVSVPIIQQATHLKGSMSARVLGIDKGPRILVEADLRKHGLHQEEGHHQNEDHDVRRSKSNYLKALAQAGLTDRTPEIPAPLDWVIGSDYESFQTIYESILESEPVLVAA